MKMKTQKGSVLLISLVFLLLLTIVGVTAMNISTLQEHMAGNYRDQDLAFQAAEAALLEGEQWVKSNSFELSQVYTNPQATGVNAFTATCNNGLCFDGTFPSSSAPVTSCVPGTTTPWTSSTLWSTATRYHQLAAADQMQGTVQNARYIIEFRCFTPRDSSNASPDPSDYAQWSPLFRITALASGSSADSQVMLQSTYKKID
ncbi:pilus assembly PilX family protein [Mangrovitalea sediminis]|uniref:pilus assembly PilX family protein n=1 Tax=Mangrovitalea sediminis TaxID=1982043 RepID=UPI000BE5ECB4|nr:PilX N-terminal domain-containing pilus assembly protein [Mangrovitalea sediminis]